MARKCDICGKKAQIGNNVSHANNRSKRTFNPNLQSVYDMFIKLYNKEDVDFIYYHLYGLEYNTEEQIFEVKEKRIKAMVDVDMSAMEKEELRTHLKKVAQ